MAINVGTLEAILRIKDELTPTIKKAAESVQSAAQSMGASLNGSAGASAAMDAVKAKAGDMSSSLGSAGTVLTAMGPAGVAAAAGLGAVLSVSLALGGAILSWSNQLVNSAGNLSDLALQAGTTTTALQEYAHIGAQVGVSQDALAVAVQRGSRIIAEGGDEAAAALGRLGLDISRVQQMRPEEQFRAVGEALRGVADSGQQAAIVNDIFGRSPEILRVLRTEMGALTEEAHRFGLVLSQEQVAALDDVGDAMTTAGEATRSIKDTIALAAIEALGGADGMRAFANSIGELAGIARAELPYIKSLFGEALDLAKAFGVDLKGQIEALKDLADTLAALRGQGPSVAKGQTTAADLIKNFGDPDQINFGKLMAEGLKVAEAETKKFAASQKVAKEAMEKAKSAAEAQAKALASLTVEYRGFGDLKALEMQQAAVEAAGGAWAVTEETIKRLGPEFLLAMDSGQQLGQTGIEVVGRWLEMRQVEEAVKNVTFVTAEAAEAAERARDAAGGFLSMVREADGEADYQAPRVLADDFKAVAKEAANAASLIGALGGFLQDLGVGAESGIGKAIGAIQGIATGTADLGAGIGRVMSGDIIGGITQGLKGLGGIIGGLKSLFGEPSWKQVGRDAGKALGMAVSEELAKTIEKTMKDLKVTAAVASLLHLDQAIAESGRSVTTFLPQIQQLIAGLADGTVPARQGIEQLESAWSEVRDEAEKAGKSFDATTVAILKAAKASGQLTSEMRAYVAEQQQLVATGAENIIAGLGQQGAASGRAFILGFMSSMASGDLRGAIEQFADEFARLAEAGVEIPGVIGEIFSLSDNEGFMGSLQAIQGVTQQLQGLAAQGMLTAENMAMLGEIAMQAFTQATESGASPEAAIVAQLPFLREAVNAAREFGGSLDANTAQLVAQAEAMGYAFPPEPLQVIADLMKTLVQGLGFDLPASAQQAGSALEGLAIAGQAVGSTTPQAIADATASVEGLGTAAVTTRVNLEAVGSTGVVAASSTTASWRETHQALEDVSSTTLGGVTADFDALQSKIIEVGEWIGISLVGNFGEIMAFKDQLPLLSDAFSLMAEQSLEPLNKIASVTSQIAGNITTAAAGASTFTVGGPPGAPATVTPLASGFDGLVERPRLFLVGESGPEHMRVTPVGQMGKQGSAGGSVSVSMHVGVTVTSPDPRAIVLAVANAVAQEDGELSRQLRQQFATRAR